MRPQEEAKGPPPWQQDKGEGIGIALRVPADHGTQTCALASKQMLVILLFVMSCTATLSCIIFTLMPWMFLLLCSLAQRIK